MTLYGMAETGRVSRSRVVDGAGLFDYRRAGTMLYKRPNHFLVVLCQGDPMATVPVEDQVKIPGNVATLTAFRHWSLSESFPKRGRIDWVGSQIEVDRSPEDLFTHGTLKTAIVASLWPLARRKGYKPLHG